MGVIFKHTIKNMFSKPFRTLMLILCILVCSFAGMMAFDMSNSIKNIFRSAFCTMAGNANVSVISKYGLEESDFEGLPEHDKTFITSTTSKLFLRNDSMYAYFNEKDLTVIAADIDEINTMELLATEVDLKEGEIAIPRALADELNLSTGDTFTIFDRDGASVDYKIKSILPYRGLLAEEYPVVMSLDSFKKLHGDSDITFFQAMVRVHDENQTREFCDKIETTVRGVEVEDFFNGDLINQQIGQISGVFIILFFVCLLLVIFVTISLSERIMVERMGTVGTLRSLGVSPNSTALIVLFENALYGLIGGVLGTLLYSGTRDFIFNNVFTLNSGSDVELKMDLGSVSKVTLVCVILGAILVECLCPIKELVKATRTAIRDLIFDNKDTDFKYTKKALVASIILLVLGVTGSVLVFTDVIQNGALMLLMPLALVISLFLGYPFILKGISILFEKLFNKLNRPVAAFSCVQARTKKATVGISRLFVMTVSMGLALFILCSSYSACVNTRPADCDVIVNGLSESSTMYEYFNDLEGVSDVEFLYRDWEVRFVIGTENIDEFMNTKDSKRMKELYHSAVFIGIDGKTEMYKEVKDLPETIADDEIYMSKKAAANLGYKEGDEMDILMAADAFIPIRKTLKIRYCDTYQVNLGSDVFVVNTNNYKEVLFDHPTEALIRTSNPDMTVQQIKNYSSSMISECQTMDDYMDYVREQNAGMTTILYMLLVMGVLLTFIGVISNQIIGFSGRRRECAVLVSTAMSKSKLKKAFFSENAISCISAMLIAVPLAVFITVLFLRAMATLSLGFEMYIDPVATPVFIAGLFVIFLLTVLLPIKHIRKMKISEQLKYE